jgi:glycosyltransferase involved in cell wall biosynthesis
MTPDLACAVLSFRNEPGLVEAVRSVLGQSEPVEVVVVNSGGGDPAARLAVMGLGDVPVHTREEPLYPGAVRNIGIEVTSAPYVAFLAADCLACEGWAAARLAAHRAGAAAVASTLTNADVDSTAAWASSLLLHNRLHWASPPGHRLLYLVSYDRKLFDRYGRFREDLRAGEDTELNARFEAEHGIVAPPGVRTAHRYPLSAGAFLRDAYRRGRLQAAMAGLVRPGARDGTRTLEVLGRWRDMARSIVKTVGRSRGEERAHLARAAPLALLGSAAYMAGAVTAPWAAYDGEERLAG